MKSDWTHIT